MHPNSIKNLRPFGKGQTSPRNGRKKVKEDLLGMREMTKEEIRRTISKICDMSRPNLKDALVENKGTAFELAFMSILEKAIEYGDHQRLDFFLNRTIGKVKEEADVNMNVQEIPTTELIQIAKDAIITIEAETKSIEAEQCPIPPTKLD